MRIIPMGLAFCSTDGLADDYGRCLINHCIYDWEKLHLQHLYYFNHLIQKRKVV